jgi:hypothetical protein
MKQLQLYRVINGKKREQYNQSIYFEADRLNPARQEAE